MGRKLEKPGTIKPATPSAPAPRAVIPAGGGAAPKPKAAGSTPRNPPPPPPPPPTSEQEPETGTTPPASETGERRYGQPSVYGSGYTREGYEPKLVTGPQVDIVKSARELETSALQPYMDKLQKVRELRQRGAAPMLEGLPIMPAAAVRGSPKGTGDGRPGRPVYPNYRNVAVPSSEELATPVLAARKASSLREQYRQALGEYERRRLATEAAKADPYIDRAVLLPYAADTREALQRVADLKASLREYGWTEEDLATLE